VAANGELELRRDRLLAAQADAPHCRRRSRPSGSPCPTTRSSPVHPRGERRGSGLGRRLPVDLPDPSERQPRPAAPVRSEPGRHGRRRLLPGPRTTSTGSTPWTASSSSTRSGSPPAQRGGPRHPVGLALRPHVHHGGAPTACPASAPVDATAGCPPVSTYTPHRRHGGPPSDEPVWWWRPQRTEQPPRPDLGWGRSPPSCRAWRSCSQGAVAGVDTVDVASTSRCRVVGRHHAGDAWGPDGIVPSPPGRSSVF
jgi:hypothetical protein